MAALETGPVSGWWIKHELHGQDATPERLRAGSRLEEAPRPRSRPVPPRRGLRPGREDRDPLRERRPHPLERPLETAPAASVFVSAQRPDA